MRNTSRTRRFRRFLVTALPTRALTVTPSRPAAAIPGAVTSTKFGMFSRRPARCTRRNSLRRRSRAALGKHWLRNTRSGRLFGRDRHGETFASLRSPATQDLSSTRCRHSCSKSVRSLPAPVAGLVGSLHRGGERREGTMSIPESQLGAERDQVVAGRGWGRRASRCKDLVRRRTRRSTRTR